MRTPQSKISTRSWPRQWLARATPMLAACFATLLALPVNAAMTLPTDPLTTGARIPPNVLLILDDSGSMANDYMPDDVPKTSNGPGDISKQTYTRNSIYYNPATVYRPWVSAAGVERTDGLDYTAVFDDTINSYPDTKTKSLAASTQTYYVPKDLTNKTETYLANGSNYYRYQILSSTSGTYAGQVIRSEWLAYKAANTPGTAKAMGCADSKSGSGWRDCQAVRPTGRTDDAEKANFAIWYSYHRTRVKAAKAGAGLAFSGLGTNLRVGFRTIWSKELRKLGTNIITDANPIPVSQNDGLFDDPNGPAGADNNRTQWFDRLYSSGAEGNTPLRTALSKAGAYFSSNSASGAYGPQTGSNQYTCRQNFAILTTDGYWNNDKSAVGEQDNEAGPTITNSKGGSYTYSPAAPYASADNYNGEGTLADVAMRYWKSDLRTDMENNVQPSTADPAFWQHMVTFGISIGMRGTLDPAADLPALTAGTLSWPGTKNNNIVNIDDLWHATINGRGSFVVATDTKSFVDGLNAALSTISERTGSFSNVSANSTSLDAGTRVFQATYVAGLWTGNVAAYPVVNKVTSTTPDWNANAGIPDTNRKVFTSDGSQGLAFPASATQAQLDALVRTGADTNYPVTGENNAAYIAGTRTLEKANGGKLRDRTNLLGDIVSSSPAYVSNTDTVYVGANDGMLHAFDAADGRELFAYIPNGISWSGLASLSRPDYSHRYFVDGPIVVSSLAQTPGENILVGALGKGGKGLFALDVTAPASFGTGDFKWEIDGTDADMGLVQSKPIIAQLNNGVTALIVSNGVNSTNGHAVLMVYNLDTGAPITKIDTGVGSAVTDSADSNGLSAPVAWDADGNGTVDYVYAGDMLGNVWKFNLGASSPGDWSVANGGEPLFQATHTAADGTVTRQPITSGMTVALHPKTFKTWLFFGTGRLMTVGDMSNYEVQSLYGIIDDGTELVRDGDDANLTMRTLQAAGTSGGRPVRAFQAKEALPFGSKGWYVDLLNPPNATVEGERVVSDTQLLGDVLVVSSVVPLASACDPNGRGYLNGLDAFTGTSSEPSLFDLNGNGIFTDDTITNGDTKLPVGSVDLGVGMPTLADLLRGLAVLGGSSGNTGSVPIRETRNVGRVSWREVKRGD